MIQLELEFEKPKPKLIEKEPKKVRRSRMDTLYLGTYCTEAEAKALETLQRLNPTIVFKSHGKKKKDKFNQDGDIFDLVGKQIGYVEIQTSKNTSFDKYYDEWQFLSRRVEKPYADSNLPVLVVFQDKLGELLVMSLKKYGEIYNSTPDKVLDIRGTTTSRGADISARRNNWKRGEKSKEFFLGFLNESRLRNKTKFVAEWLETGIFKRKP